MYLDIKIYHIIQVYSIVYGIFSSYCGRRFRSQNSVQIFLYANSQDVSEHRFMETSVRKRLVSLNNCI